MKAALTLILLTLGSAAIPAAAERGTPGAPAYPGAGAPPPGFLDQSGGGSDFASGVAPPMLGDDPDYYAPPASSDRGSSYRSEPAYINNFTGASTGSGADLLTYSYVEGGYRYVNPRGGALDGNHGLGIGVSLALFQPFFLKAGFNWGSGTGGNTVRSAMDADYEFATITVGGGGYMPITEKLHVVGEVGLLYANLDADRHRLSYTEGGVFLRPSIRYQALDNLEIQAGLTLSSADDYDGRLFDIGAYYRVFPQFDLNAGADFGDENRTMKLGARLRW